MNDQFVRELFSLSGESLPPLLRNSPLQFRIYLSCCDFRSLWKFSCFFCKRSIQFFRSVVSQSERALKRFLKLASSMLCFARRVFKAIQILSSRFQSQLAFSAFSLAKMSCWTSCAYAKLRYCNHYFFCLTICSSIFLRFKSSELSLTFGESSTSSSFLKASSSCLCLASSYFSDFSDSWSTSLFL